MSVVRENYERITQEKQWLPRIVNPNLRTTAIRSLQSRIMRSRDMNRLRCHHDNRLMDVHGVVMSRVIIITSHARRSASANGKVLVSLILQRVYMYQRGLLVMERWTCSFQHA